MLTIKNASNGRQTDYSLDQLKHEARHAVKHLPDSDGKLRAWSVYCLEGVTCPVQLRADYLTPDGEPKTHYIIL